MIEYRNLYWDAPDHSRMQADVWDYGAASASGIIDRLIAGGNQDA